MSSPFPDAALGLYAAQQRRLARLNRSLAGRWRLMGGDFEASWRHVGPMVVAEVTQAQKGAAQDSILAQRAVMEHSPSGVTTVGQVDAAAFAGVASDGRDLGGLLYSSVITARTLGRDATLTQRLDAGFADLEKHAVTQVADATRQAAGVVTAASRYYQYQRLVAPGCCKRCAALAGKTFRWNQGFQRHPRCRCIHVVLDEKRPGYTNDIDASRVRDLTKAQRRAIDDGADMNQVINADRGRSRDGMTTLEGTTKRGYYTAVRRRMDEMRGQDTAYMTTGYRQQGFVQNYPERRTRRSRLTPEAIYKHADSRDEAIRMLAANGYIVGDIKKVAASAIP